MRQKNRGVIVIIGIDGSGKTTLARNIASSLLARGWNTKYVYARFVPVLSRPLVFLAQIILNKKTSRNQLTSMVDRFAKRKLLSINAIALMQESIFFIDYLCQLIMKVWIPYYEGYLLICDRYVQDTVLTDLAIDRRWGLKKIISRIRIYEKMAPRASIIIFLSVSPENALKRKQDIPDRKYIDERCELYSLIANEIGARVIDANLTLNIIYDQTMKIIETELKNIGI